MNEKIELKEIPDKKISGKVAMLELASSVLDALEEPRGFGARVEFWVNRDTIDEICEAIRDKINESNGEKNIKRGENLLDRVNQWEDELSKKCHAMWNSTHGIGYLDGYTIEKGELVERDFVMATLSRAFALYGYTPVHDFAVSMMESFGEYVNPDLETELLEDQDLFDDINDFLEVDQPRAFGFSYMFSDVIREANDLYQSADDNMYYEWEEMREDGVEVKELYDEIYQDLPEDAQAQLNKLLKKTDGAREVFYAQADYLIESLAVDRKQSPVVIPNSLFGFES